MYKWQPAVRCVEENGVHYAYASADGYELGFATGETAEVALKELSLILTVKLAEVVSLIRLPKPDRPTLKCEAE